MLRKTNNFDTQYLFGKRLSLVYSFKRIANGLRVCGLSDSRRLKRKNCTNVVLINTVYWAKQHWCHFNNASCFQNLILDFYLYSTLFIWPLNFGIKLI